MSLELCPRPASSNRSVRSALAPPAVPGERADAVVVFRGKTDVSTDLGKSLFWAMRSSAGDVVVDLTEAESIDISSVQLLAKVQRLLNSEGRKLTFRSLSQLDALVRNLYG